MKQYNAEKTPLRAGRRLFYLCLILSLSFRQLLRQRLLKHADRTARDLVIDVERVEFIGTPDDTTCEVCGEMDGKVIPVTQYEPGVTVPPYHPNCRCTTAPSIDDVYGGARAARDKDGEFYYVHANMTYDEWKSQFLLNEPKKTYFGLE